MENKENIYNNIGQINISDTKIDRTTGYGKIDNSYNTIVTPCIICGSSIDAFSSQMICDDCKEAVKWAKRCMKVAEKQQENTLKKPKTMCPHCGSFNTQLMYGTAALYDYDKGVQSLTEHFMCRDCLKEFDIATK